MFLLKGTFTLLLSYFILNNAICNEELIAKIVKESNLVTELEWYDAEQDLGIVEQKTTLQVKFKFKNIGKHPLVIDKVEPSCGCTLVKKAKNVVVPDNQSVLEAEYMVNTLKGSFFKKEIEIHGNFQNSPKILTFIGRVKK